jgi:hypothetical protein
VQLIRADFAGVTRKMRAPLNGAYRLSRLPDRLTEFRVEHTIPPAVVLALHFFGIEHPVEAAALVRSVHYVLHPELRPDAPYPRIRGFYSIATSAFMSAALVLNSLSTSGHREAIPRPRERHHPAEDALHLSNSLSDPPVASGRPPSPNAARMPIAAESIFEGSSDPSLTRR